MGRKKITIERIEDDKSRATTFQKRKVGLMKKAMELSILCGADVALVVFSEEDRLFQYSSMPMGKLLDKYDQYEGSVDVLVDSDLDELVPGRASSFKVGRQRAKRPRAAAGSRAPGEAADIGEGAKPKRQKLQRMPSSSSASSLSSSSRLGKEGAAAQKLISPGSSSISLPASSHLEAKRLRGKRLEAAKTLSHLKIPPVSNAGVVAILKSGSPPAGSSSAGGQDSAAAAAKSPTQSAFTARAGDDAAQAVINLATPTFPPGQLSSLIASATRGTAAGSAAQAVSSPKPGQIGSVGGAGSSAGGSSSSRGALKRINSMGSVGMMPLSASGDVSQAALIAALQRSSTAAPGTNPAQSPSMFLADMGASGSQTPQELSEMYRQISSGHAFASMMTPVGTPGGGGTAGGGASPRSWAAAFQSRRRPRRG